MRSFQLVAALLLPLTSLAAKKPTGDLFLDFYSQQVSNAAPVKLDDTLYAEITKAPRNYSAAILLTALDARFSCGLCNDFQPEWELLAKTWTKGDKGMESRLLFGTLDFMDGKNTFQSVRSSNRVDVVGDVLMLDSLCSKLHRCSCSSIRLSGPMRSRRVDL